MWLEGKYKEHTVEDAVSLCAKLVPLFEGAGIPVIRLGLNPTEELSGGSAAAVRIIPPFGSSFSRASTYKNGKAAFKG
jgi:histone acetyltransferase (RNA polymerase elongator complex component)